MESQRKTNHKDDHNRIVTDSPPPFSNLSPHDIYQMLQPFHHDQLLNLLHTAAIRHTDVLLSIRDFSDRDTSFRRLYVRSLGAETTSETLHRVFSPFGEIEEAIVITDKSTGRSKGFGFVTFKHLDGAYLALKNPSKRINGRMTLTHLASAGVSIWNDDVSSRKIFVANIPFVIPPGKLLNHFLRYGEVEEGPLGFDRACGREKGFAFFIYKTEEGANAAIREPLKFGHTSGGGGGCGHGSDSSSNVDPRRTSPLPPNSAVGVPATASGSQSQGSSSHHEQPKPASKVLP
ncbi:putative RNA recognition motif domain-containing protein [Lupinus albus]|uniref:Putative RNA recognition motif domain-containing protein n=1 Tax=Lupinus albus TaxID=3870 RepID=A0A6A4P0K0_LUPAL|nr:putative RNA recognition motif domain-containing protein [Lupinus albus]